MPPVSFDDEEMKAITSLASALPRAARGEFLQLVANRLSAYPPDVRGAGLVYRLAVESQRSFLQGGMMAVGRPTKYSRMPRRGRRG